jgi:hypothetical protein
MVLILAVLVILVSLATFVGPAAIFYGSAAMCFLMDLIELLNYSSIGAGNVFVTLSVVTLSLGLGLVAARNRTSVSEQANPMNLPVFG